MILENQFLALRQGAKELRQLSSEIKNKILFEIASALIVHQDELLEKNALDLANLTENTNAAFRDRLALNPSRVQAMAESLRQVAALTDPVGEVTEERILENKLVLRRVRAPLGVIFMIFESRPNVILEAFSLAFKSGNAIALRGGSESKESANFIYSLIENQLIHAGLKYLCFYGVRDYDRSLINSLLARPDLIDVVVPRGGEKLIALVTEKARMPIIKNDRGLCHCYVAADADLSMATAIVINAKTQRPGVCNALETLLVNRQIASRFLPELAKATQPLSLEWRCDEDSLSLVGQRARLATGQDWNTEHLDLIINCRIVDSLDQALAHIEKYGSKHSEAIITSDRALAKRFQNEVDAAAVYWNASTRFTDGFCFGLGGELGISTQKLHVRGPVGLRELTSLRWIIDGQGQIR